MIDISPDDLMTTNPFDQLLARGLVDQATNTERLREYLVSTDPSMYIGFDPTAPSLHVGHLLPIMAASHLQRLGVRPIMLVGGATGVIGDPSGRSSERNLQTLDVVRQNTALIGEQLSKFVSFSGEHAALLVNNHDWIAPISMLDWLRDVGKHFSINMMLGKDSVRRRLEERETGLSYTEFSYMLLQSFDFQHLFEVYGCRLQGGGSDQWGNIVAGVELVRKVHGEEVHGVTFPLVSTAAGEKFGKSAGNAVWLDARLTSPFQFFQFWFHTDDRDVENYLKFFTFLPLDQIAGLVAEQSKTPELRHAQRRLALDVTGTVHGADLATQAARVSSIAFQQGGVDGLSVSDWEMLARDIPFASLNRRSIEPEMGIVDLCVAVGLVKSKGDARRLIKQSGLSINDERVNAVDRKVTVTDLNQGRFLLLRRGSQHVMLVAVD